MNMVIPHQSSDTVATAQTQCLQCRCQSAGSLMHFAVSVSVDRVVRPAGNNFNGGKQFTGPFQQRSECERKLHHGSLHGRVTKSGTCVNCQAFYSAREKHGREGSDSAWEICLQLEKLADRSAHATPPFIGARFGPSLMC